MQNHLSAVLRFLIPTTIASILGIVILVVLEAGISPVLNPIIDAIYPPRMMPGTIPTSSNYGRYNEAYDTLYWISTCIAGIVAGFYLNISMPTSQSRRWHCFISGIIIGASGPLIFSGSWGIIFGLPAIVAALMGYEIHLYKLNFGKLIRKVAISSLVGLIVFGGLSVLFASTLQELFSGGEFSEGFLIKALFLFLITLGVSGFISGWRGTDAGNLKHGLISGFIVGAIGPFLGQFLDRATSLFNVLLLFGSIAGLFGFLGNICGYRYYYWRSGSSGNLSQPGKAT